MTDLLITGKPLAQFAFKFIPSWNNVFGRGHWRNAQRATKHWREKAERLALKWRDRVDSPCLRITDRAAKSGRAVGHHHEPFVLTGRTLVVVRVIRKPVKAGTERKYDVHNVWLKAIFDGFSDAGLWPDDEWRYVPTVLNTWSYDYEGLGQRFIIQIHPFGRMVVNGDIQILPKGREEVCGDF